MLCGKISGYSFVFFPFSVVWLNYHRNLEFDLPWLFMEPRAQAHDELINILEHVSFFKTVNSIVVSFYCIWSYILIFAIYFFLVKIRGDKCLVIDPKLSGTLSLLVLSAKLKVFRVIFDRFYGFELFFCITMIISCWRNGLNPIQFHGILMLKAMISFIILMPSVCWSLWICENPFTHPADQTNCCIVSSDLFKCLGLER